MIGRRLWMPRPFQSFLLVLIFSLASTALAQEAQPTNDQLGEKPSQQTTDQQPGNQQPGDQQLPGSISGVVVDGTGAAIAGARITLTREDKSPGQQVASDADGQFSFAAVAPGPFQLQVASAAFATQISSGILHSGEMYAAPQITLAVAPEITEVQVVLPRVQVAEEEIKEQEKQRVLGFIPNFYVSYIPQLPSIRNKSLSLRGRLPWIQPLSESLAALQEFSRRQINMADMGRARQATESATAQRTAI
jgi:hypothetical protein